MTDYRFIGRSICFVLAALALSSCGGVRLAASRDYVPRYETMPRSINQTDEEHESVRRQYGIWASAGHVVFLSNAGSKNVELTGVEVIFQDAAINPVMLTDSVDLPSGGTISLPIETPAETKVECLIPVLLRGNFRMGDDPGYKPFSLAFAEPMGRAHVREWRQAKCDQSPFEMPGSQQAAWAH